MTTPIEPLRRVTRLRAARLGTYPSSTIAASTARRMSGLTLGEPFTTRETVARETPAREATSSRVVPLRRSRVLESATVTPSRVRALSRSVRTISPRVKRALSHSFGGRSARFGRRAGVPRPAPGRRMRNLPHGRDGDTRARRALERYEAVIGIEVHCQLRTASKMFCGCSTAYDGAPPNSHVCPVCLGLPGALPVINQRAVEHVLATGLAIEADGPAGDALGSQELLLPGPAQGLPDQPVRPAARVARAPDRSRPRTGRSRSAITRAHLEEDTAKLVHQAGPDGRRVSLVDFNRSGRAADGDRHRARASGPPSRPAATPRSSSCCSARSARRTPTWSAARCGSRRTSRCGRAARSRSGRGSRSRT